MSMRFVSSHDVEIATEAFGDSAHPPVLLIMGGMASMLWWRERFCRQLAERGRFVIRYDQRDTSTRQVGRDMLSMMLLTTSSGCSTVTGFPPPTSSGCLSVGWSARLPRSSIPNACVP